MEQKPNPLADLGAILRRIRKAQKLTLQDVADLAETDTGNLSRIETGKQVCSHDMMERITKAIGTTTQDVYEEAFEVADVKLSKWMAESPAIKGSVPLVSWVQAGTWALADDPLQPGEGERIPTTYQARAHTFALRVRGDSMEPKFPEGCIIIVEPESEATPGQYVVVRQNGDDATFKQLVQDGSRMYLKPLNPRYPIMEMAPDAVICGVVKRMEMDFS